MSTNPINKCFHLKCKNIKCLFHFPIANDTKVKPPPTNEKSKDNKLNQLTHTKMTNHNYNKFPK
jgi:hypothetical protein